MDTSNLSAGGDDARVSRRVKRSILPMSFLCYTFGDTDQISVVG